MVLPMQRSLAYHQGAPFPMMSLAKYLARPQPANVARVAGLCVLLTRAAAVQLASTPVSSLHRQSYFLERIYTMQ